MMERRLRVISSLLVRSLPADVRKALYTDTKFCERIGIETAAAFALGKDVSVRSISLLDALRAAVDGRKSTRLILADGKGVRVKLSVNKGGSAVVHLGAGAFQLKTLTSFRRKLWCGGKRSSGYSRSSLFLKKRRSVGAKFFNSKAQQG